MRALYFKEDRLYYRPNYQEPERQPGQALIEVSLAGICSTDLEIVRGYAGFEGVPGHEFVGTVLEADDGDLVGKRVVGGINLGCGICGICLGQGPEHCPDRTVLGIINHDGAFADLLTLPESNLLEVPNDIEDERAVFAEPLAAALRILEQEVVSPSSAMAVVGPGKLGMLIAQVMRLAGGHVVVLGRRAESLVFPEKLGFQIGIASHVAAESFDIVVEATGNEAGLAHSLRIIKPQGLLVLKSTFAGLASVDLSRIVVSEIRVIGSRCGPFEPALRLLAAGEIEVAGMIEAIYPLDKGLDAFEHAAQPGVRKILLMT